MQAAVFDPELGVWVAQPEHMQRCQLEPLSEEVKERLLKQKSGAYAPAVTLTHSDSSTEHLLSCIPVSAYTVHINVGAQAGFIPTSNWHCSPPLLCVRCGCMALFTTSLVCEMRMHACMPTAHPCLPQLPSQAPQLLRP